MNAIREYVNVQKGNIIHFQLPDDFQATAVEIIILPVEKQIEKLIGRKRDRILSMKGTIVGKMADSLDNHIKTIREEW